MESVARREVEGTTFALLDGHVDTARRVVERGGTVVRLTGREAELIEFLASRAGQTLPRERLLAEVFGYQPTARTRTLDTTIRRVRAKIEPDPGRPQLLQTVHGTGYRWIAPQGVHQEQRPTVAIGPRAHVPRDPMPLVGREQELALVLQGLAEGPVAITGPGGVGKSRLAREAAHRWSVATGAPAWWVDVEDLKDPAELAARISRAMALRVSSVEALGERLARMGPLLLVLDGADRLDPAILRPLLPQLLLTLRVRPELEVRLVRLSPLAQEEAEQLFLSCARTRVPTFDAERAELAAVVHAVDGLPLALQLAAARVRVLDLRQLRARLERGIDVLAEVSDPSEHGALHRVLARSWELLAPPWRAAAVACAVPGGPFDLETARAILGEGADEALEALVDASWVERTTAGFAVLATVRSWLRAREPQVAASALAALARARAAQAAQLDPLFGPTTLEAALWLKRAAVDLPRLLPVATEEDRPALWLAAGFAARAVGDEAGAMRAWSALGGRLGALHRARSTSLSPEQRLALLEEDEGDTSADPRLAAILALERQRVLVLGRTGDPEQIAAIRERLQDPVGIAEACWLEASAHADRGQWDLAARARAIGLRAVAGMKTLVEIELLIAPFPLPKSEEPTLEAIRAALDTARVASERRKVARVVTVLAMGALSRGRMEEAASAALEAVEAVAGLSSPTLRAGVFGNAGIVLRELRRFEEADRLFQRVFEELSARPYRLSSAINLAWSSLDQGQLQQAQRWIAVAEPLAADVVSRSTLELLRGMCEVLLQRADAPGAGAARWRATLEPLRASGAPTHLARALLVLATSDPPDAKALLDEAWSLAERYDDEAVRIATNDLWTRRGHPARMTPPADQPDPGLWLGLVRLVRRLSHAFTSRS